MKSYCRKLPRIIEEPTDNPSLPFKERTLPAFIALEDSDNHEPSSASNAQLSEIHITCNVLNAHVLPINLSICWYIYISLREILLIENSE